jgi:nitrogen regulatory protein PII
MEKQTVILLTIIAESILMEQVCKLALEAGATGYTMTDCIGSGTKGIRTGTMDMDKNVRIEILARQETAETIMEQVEKRFAQNYALTLFTQTVTALTYGHPY